VAETEVLVKKIDVRGTEIAYRRAGRGPTIVFFHGLGFSRRWTPLYERLARNFDVIVPDLQGFGDSAPADWMTGLEDLVLHYAEFADVLGLERFHLVGHSFGGWLAAEFASFYPERLASLTLITPLGLRVRGDTPTDLFRMSAESRLAVMLNGRTDGLLDDSGQAPLEQLLQDYADLTAFGRFAWNPRYDIRLDRRLGRVACPSLVIGVEEDRVLPAAHVFRYAELLPNGRSVLVQGTEAESGHGVVVQEPDAVAAEIETLTGVK
jgi:pimeloyl-ACP methyl ester carboxylesterase